MSAPSTNISTATTMDFRTGEDIKPLVANAGVFSWELKNPIWIRVQDLTWLNNNPQVYHVHMRFNHNLRKPLHLNKCWISFRLQTQHKRCWEPSFKRILHHFIFRFLDNIGVISINYVIRAINALFDNHEWITDVRDIEYNVQESLY